MSTPELAKAFIRDAVALSEEAAADWPQILALYKLLLSLAPSPVR